MEKSALTGKLLKTLVQKNWDLIINLGTQTELKQQYNWEVRGFCKTFCFGVAKVVSPSVVDKSSLNNVIEMVTEKVSLLKSLIFSVKSRSSQSLANPRVIMMKLLAILEFYTNQLIEIIVIISLYLLLFISISQALVLMVLSYPTILTFRFHMTSCRRSCKV